MRKLIDAPANQQTGDVIGKSQPHESAIRQVTGQARYVDDYVVPMGTYHAAVGLATDTRATLKGLDLEAVRQSPGVIDVITIDDIPGQRDIAPVFDGDPILVDGEIRFHGQPLFAVLADTHRHAQQAATKARVVSEPLPPCLSVSQAHEQQRFVRPLHRMERGDWQAGLESSQHIASAHLSIGGQEHMYLEGQVALAIPDEEDRLLIHTSSQHPSEVQKLVAEVLDVPLNKVVVDMRRMGGGFGGKETQAAQWACLAAVLARRNGRAVKLRLPRAQDMQATGKRHPFENGYTVGFDAQGLIQACHVDISGNCGISADLSDAIVDRAMFHADNGYYLGDCLVEGHRCQTNQVSHTAFRGFGGPQGMIMAEAMMDRIARTVQQDPLSVRKRNLYDADARSETHYGMPVGKPLLADLIEKLEHSSDYWQRREAITAFNQGSPVIKRGLALTPVKFGISFTAKHLNQAGALVHVYTDGSVQVNHGGTEMGQGLHTKIAQIAANELGIGTDGIEVTATRTDKVPNTSPTAASSGTDINGKAVQNACQQIRQRLAEFYAASVNGDADTVVFSQGRVQCNGKSTTFQDLVQQAYIGRVSLSASGFYKTPKIHYDRDTGKGRPFFYFAYGAACSEVQLDVLTGEYKVTRVDILHDVGNSINPAIDRGQIEGGFIQGMGWLTTEELRWNADGKLDSNNPATYKIPAIGDTPAIFNVDLYPRANDEDSIYHSKAVGEPPFMLAISVWCAIKDAIASTADYRHDPDLNTPATPEQVLWALKSLEEPS
ncbi:xanthine dehydrogenase molybdopterin binding subunit [Aestuariibacter halophilus]|uniref:Xanthine dehydrogenase molybdopterin binding subunit n=1 Tax=Fluctibacter halophilus TaxID=226011 RepID=A0ABS8G7D7_9ALTE|nr:xanthine dehydrogenase molybdopterin binding subunit [Aestuariibacter halophilus]MCC2615735.1 xanthine dehydrogenase molybdopterin binding subunit [Aestuariibacter halophilus]